MRDDNFGYFIEEFGEATQHITVPFGAIEKWRGRLPDNLLNY
ncbi:hypothetical protein PSI22_12500 [Xenorhabdus sp. XENO-7]|uniref:Uncharacterized protein n=1 Tax=Xenorhabdus aichiensis TaxID=3025874 RepID=A0ABT5M420_9GAMM|nr:hypothetical protein [Xenorhabdus aichiensis]MDC9622434.1 hypothetical protein [Xenorhabdus aichiensis]